MILVNVLFGSQLIGWLRLETIYRSKLLNARYHDCTKICYAFSKADMLVAMDDVTRQHGSGQGLERQGSRVLGHAAL